MEKTIKLKLRAKHFTTFSTGFDKNRNLKASCGCAIERALFEVFQKENIEDSVTHTIISGTRYDHKPYLSDDFYEDKEKASEAYPEKIIRIIILTKA